jgi:hypothetical protein
MSVSVSMSVGVSPGGGSGAGYFPVKAGLRFSMKALRPSA